MKEENPWKTLKTTRAYDNPWIGIKHSEVLNPAGNPTTYGVVDFKNIAVGVMVLDQNNDTYLVGQYRYALNKYSWEIPEGGCPKNEKPLDTAKRELLEETGIVAKEYQVILEMDLSNSVTNETCVCFLAKDLSYHTAQPEESEELKIKKVSFQQAYQMVIKNEITDAISVAAILKTKILIDENKV